MVKEVKLIAQARGIRIHQYLDDWLLRAPCPETCLQHTQTLLALGHKLGWVVNMKKSELIPQEVFNFVGYWFDLLTSRVLPTQERWHALQEKLRFYQGQEILHSQAVRVADRTAHGNREAGMVRSPSHETNTVASETTLAYTGGSGKDHSIAPFPPSTPGLVVKREQCSSGPTFASPSTCPSNVYRRLKLRLGRTLRGLHGKRRLVRHRKSPPHQPLGS